MSELSCESIWNVFPNSVFNQWQFQSELESSHFVVSKTYCSQGTSRTFKALSKVFALLDLCIQLFSAGYKSEVCLWIECGNQVLGGTDELIHKLQICMLEGKLTMCCAKKVMLPTKGLNTTTTMNVTNTNNNDQSLLRLQQILWSA